MVLNIANASTRSQRQPEACRTWYGRCVSCFTLLLLFCGHQLSGVPSCWAILVGRCDALSCLAITGCRRLRVVISLLIPARRLPRRGRPRQAQWSRSERRIRPRRLALLGRRVNDLAA